MPGRIVLYGATGYIGGLIARAMIAHGARPVLAGRNQGRLSALAARLRQTGDGTELETAVADTESRSLHDLVRPGDVLVSTAGPFVKVGRPVVEAAVDVGAVYLDSSGEPPFIRQVFEEFGPRAERTGAVLLTAFGYDYVPGNLAGALALAAAGSAATRVRVGYFVSGDIRRGTSAGTRASVIDTLLEPGYAFRGGRVVTERSAAQVTSFEVEGRRREAFSIGASEHFALPRLRTSGPGRSATPATLTDVGVYLGWFGRATRLVQYGSTLAVAMHRVPGVRHAVDTLARRIQHTRAAPDAAVTIRTDVVAEAADAKGRVLALAHLVGGDPYSFTAPFLAWTASQAAAQTATQSMRPAGALGPVEAFGPDPVESACAAGGFHRAR
jgi:short subunit dehydrogenase-like uncharacterized protein